MSWNEALKINFIIVSVIACMLVLIEECWYTLYTLIFGKVGFSLVIDCGAGVGRVTKNFLIHHFQEVRGRPLGTCGNRIE